MCHEKFDDDHAMNDQYSSLTFMQQGKINWLLDLYSRNDTKFNSAKMWQESRSSLADRNAYPAAFWQSLYFESKKLAKTNDRSINCENLKKLQKHARFWAMLA